MGFNMLLKRVSRDILQSRIVCFKTRPLLLPVTASINSKRNYADVWEPAYLDEKDSDHEFYDLINVQIKGYDCPVLEKYGQFIHKSAQRFGVEVEDCWPTPLKKMKITRLKPESTTVDSEYVLNEYERNVQLADVPSMTLPLIINFIEAAIPPGVKMSVYPHEPDHEEIRYIPDYKLMQLQEELEDLKNPTQKKRGYTKKRDVKIIK